MSLKSKLNLHCASRLATLLEIDRNLLRRVKEGESSAPLLFALIVNTFFDNELELKDLLTDSDKLKFERVEEKIALNKKKNIV